MKKILKYISYCLPVLALAVGCTKADGISEFQPATNKSGNVTLLASIENADSRAQVVATGEARWLRNDAIAVLCDDGSIEKFNLDGTGETRRALFTGTVEGKNVGEYALYPAEATYSNGTLTATLSATTPISATGSCSIMAGVINEKNEVEFKQLTAYVSLQLSKVSDKAKSIVISADKSLSGEFSVALPEAFETGIVAVAGENTITIDLSGNTSATVNALFPIPVGDYSYLKATALSEAGVSLGEVSLASGLMSATRGLLLSYNLEMPQASKPTPIPGTVNVAGIYWALGNLEYDNAGATSNGFAEGWCIAPSQAHYLRYEEKPDGGDITGLTDFSKYDHFNFGGIANPFSAVATDAIDVATAGFNFGGKMYTDQACTAETTDFAAAKYGDIAHWASRGQYRMPSDVEFNALLEKASAYVATYTLNGVNISGIYFVDPAAGEAPVQDVVNTKTLTDADLEVGLFLPYAGRGYNKESTQYNIYKFGAQCWLRTSVVDTNSAAGACYGVLFAPHYLASDLSKVIYFYNAAYGSTGRYSIRPVYVSGNVGPVNPTPTPTPDPTPEPEPEPEPTPGPDTDPVPTTGTVTVAGIDWAIGNLYFENGGTTTDGFVAGWSIGAGQHYHLYLGHTGDKDDIADLSRMGHFNFGGIENPFINDLASCASIAGKNDISGKMYTDQTCVNATTDFAAAKYGDIAFWASKGAYRMPTAEEMEKLYTDACRVKAVYTTADGVEVPGTYFYNPASGETAGLIEVDAPRAVRNADMAKGLFLPYTGRYQSGNELKLFAITTQGVYRSATTTSSSTLESTYGAVYRPHITTEDSTKCDPEFVNSYYQSKNQAAYGCVSRYAIRPVKVK